MQIGLADWKAEKGLCNAKLRQARCVLLAVLEERPQCGNLQWTNDYPSGCRMGGVRPKKIALGQMKGHVGTFASGNIGATQLQGYLVFCGRRSHSSRKCIGLQTSPVMGTK